MSFTTDERAALPTSHERQGGRPALRTLIGSCISMLIGPSPLIMLSFGVYLLPIVKDTGWDRTVVASAISAPLIIAGLMAPLVGWLTNHFGPRRFLTVSFPAFGAAIMLLATSTSASMFLATMALGGVLMSGQTLVPFVYSVSGWFRERRGFALGLTLAFTGVGLAVMPPLAAHLIERIGWRATYLVFGATVMVIGIPVARWLIADPPVVSAADRASVPGVLWRTALATRSCWLLMGSITLLGATASAGAVNLHVMLVERGVSPERASFVMSVLGVSMIGARLLFGYLFDRLRAQSLTAFVALLAAAAFLVLVTSASPLAVVIAAVLLGIGFGAEGDALSYMTSQAFGMRNFGTIFGIMFLVFTTGGSAGPMIFALLKSRTGDYQSALWLSVGSCVLAAVLVLLIKDRELPYATHPGRKLASGNSVLTQNA